MEKRVKVLTSWRADDLEDWINKFLAEHEGKLHNIEFSANDYEEGGSSYSCLIVYTPNGDVDE